MKKVVLLFALMSLVFVGCGDTFEPKASAFRTVEYNRHTYIIYDGDNFDSGMVHDPDCQCRKEVSP